MLMVFIQSTSHHNIIRCTLYLNTTLHHFLRTSRMGYEILPHYPIPATYFSCTLVTRSRRKLIERDAKTVGSLANPGLSHPQLKAETHTHTG